MILEITADWTLNNTPAGLAPADEFILPGGTALTHGPGDPVPIQILGSFVLIESDDIDIDDMGGMYDVSFRLRYGCSDVNGNCPECGVSNFPNNISFPLRITNFSLIPEPTSAWGIFHLCLVAMRYRRRRSCAKSIS